MVRPVIETKDLCFSYTRERKLLENINFKLLPGERLSLTGANGSGKTTLLYLLLGLLKPAAGFVEAFGRRRDNEQDFYDVRGRAGLLFQDPEDQLFCPTVLEDVAFGPLNLGKTAEEAGDTARRTLDMLGLSGFEDRITYKLSVGEKRLVSLASVLAMEPEVLLLDEPTAGVDAVIVKRIIRILNSSSVSLLVVSHDGDFVRDVADGAAFLEEVAADGAGSRLVLRVP